MRAVVLVLAAVRNLRDLFAVAVGFGVVALVASYCSGCGAVAVKPILGTACAGARVACRLIDQACDVAEGTTSGAEAP